jgi:hypothetical protein
VKGGLILAWRTAEAQHSPFRLDWPGFRFLLFVNGHLNTRCIGRTARLVPKESDFEFLAVIKMALVCLDISAHATPASSVVTYVPVAWW